VNAVSVGLLLSIVLIPDTPLRAVLGISFLLFFPGYMVMSALFPGKNGIGEIERFALSIGLSLAVIPLLGFALNYTTWGVRLYPIIISLFIITLLLSIVSHYRRAKLPVEQKFNPSFSVKVPKWSTIPKLDKFFISGFFIAITVVAGLTVYIASGSQTGEPFTEFYLLGSNGKLADYPLNLTLGEKGTVTLGIVNHENGKVTYQINVGFNDRTIDKFENIQLDSEAAWNQTYTFTPQTAGDKLKLEFQLYKEGTAQVYRSLQLWVNVQSTK
jgi:uncharacterized membrane protein